MTAATQRVGYVKHYNYVGSGQGTCVGSSSGRLATHTSRTGR
jgi:hypothetical protein